MVECGPSGYSREVYYGVQHREGALSAVSNHIVTLVDRFNKQADKMRSLFNAHSSSCSPGSIKASSSAFQTDSMETASEIPTKYVTIVARKGKSEAYVTYESSTWTETAKTIINEMIKAIKV